MTDIRQTSIKRRPDMFAQGDYATHRDTVETDVILKGTEPAEFGCAVSWVAGEDRAVELGGTNFAGIIPRKLTHVANTNGVQGINVGQPCICAEAGAFIVPIFEDVVARTGDVTYDTTTGYFGTSTGEVVSNAEWVDSGTVAGAGMAHVRIKDSK